MGSRNPTPQGSLNAREFARSMASCGLTVVSGLALAGASAIAHDIYARVIMKGHASERSELLVSKLASIGLGIIAIVLGFIALLHPPLATALGIYTLWVLLPADAEREYSQMAEAA